MHSAVHSYHIVSVMTWLHLPFIMLSKDNKVAKHSFHFQIGQLRCCDAEVLAKSLHRELITCLAFHTLV